jgi:hypothetical protein
MPTSKTASKAKPAGKPARKPAPPVAASKKAVVPVAKKTNVTVSKPAPVSSQTAPVAAIPSSGVMDALRMPWVYVTITAILAFVLGLLVGHWVW